jgi:hypothetical protein
MPRRSVTVRAAQIVGDHRDRGRSRAGAACPAPTARARGVEQGPSPPASVGAALHPNIRVTRADRSPGPTKPHTACSPAVKGRMCAAVPYRADAMSRTEATGVRQDPMSCSGWRTTWRTSRARRPPSTPRPALGAADGTRPSSPHLSSTTLVIRPRRRQSRGDRHLASTSFGCGWSATATSAYRANEGPWAPRHARRSAVRTCRPGLIDQGLWAGRAPQRPMSARGGGRAAPPGRPLHGPW